VINKTIKGTKDQCEAFAEISEMLKDGDVELTAKSIEDKAKDGKKEENENDSSVS